MAAPEATQAPEETANAWERIQAAGKIVVGTAADYPPFESYVAEGQIDGFDIALMGEIAELAAASVLLLLTVFVVVNGALGWCPAYVPFGISSCRTS